MEHEEELLSRSVVPQEALLLRLLVGQAQYKLLGKEGDRLMQVEGSMLCPILVGRPEQCRGPTDSSKNGTSGMSFRVQVRSC